MYAECLFGTKAHKRKITEKLTQNGFGLDCEYFLLSEMIKSTSKENLPRSAISMKVFHHTTARAIKWKFFDVKWNLLSSFLNSNIKSVSCRQNISFLHFSRSVVVCLFRLRWDRKEFFTFSARFFRDFIVRLVPSNCNFLMYLHSLFLFHCWRLKSHGFSHYFLISFHPYSILEICEKKQ